MSFWNICARISIIDNFLLKEKPYYWKTICKENCKSANNKNLLMAQYRAAKNKRRYMKVLKFQQYQMKTDIFF